MQRRGRGRMRCGSGPESKSTCSAVRHDAGQAVVRWCTAGGNHLDGADVGSSLQERGDRGRARLVCLDKRNAAAQPCAGCAAWRGAKRERRAACRRERNGARQRRRLTCVGRTGRCGVALSAAGEDKVSTGCAYNGSVCHNWQCHAQTREQHWRCLGIRDHTAWTRQAEAEDAVRHGVACCKEPAGIFGCTVSTAKNANRGAATDGLHRSGISARDEIEPHAHQGLRALCPELDPSVAGTVQDGAEKKRDHQRISAAAKGTCE